MTKVDLAVHRRAHAFGADIAVTTRGSIARASPPRPALPGSRDRGGRDCRLPSERGQRRFRLGMQDRSIEPARPTHDHDLICD